MAVDRTNLGLRMARFLSSDLPLQGRYPTLALASAPGADAHARSGGRSTTPAGSVMTSDRAARRWSLRRRRADADRTAVVQLKASFDPRWTVTVDGRDAPTEMISAGVRRGQGGSRATIGSSSCTTRIHFYWLLFALGAVVMIALVIIERRFLRPRPRGRGSRLGPEHRA